MDAQIAAHPGEFALNAQIHHGLSSQALLFNLIGPLVVRNDLEPLAAACTSAGIPWPVGDVATRFEEVNVELFNERRGQPTSIDLVLRGEGQGGALCIEAKFTESGFGGCTLYDERRCDGANPAHDFSRCALHTEMRRRYWEEMARHGLITGAVADGEQCALAKDYQFFREALYALHEGGTLVLLHDARSPVFVGAPQSNLPRLRALVPAAYQDRIVALTVQEVFAAIVASGRHDDWTEAFADKYGLEHLG